MVFFEVGKCSSPSQLIPNLSPPVIRKFQRNVASGTLTGQWRDIFAAIFFLTFSGQYIFFSNILVANQVNWSKHIFVMVFFIIACSYVPILVNSFQILSPPVIRKFQRKYGEWDAYWSIQGYFRCHIFLTLSGQYISSILFKNKIVANQENRSRHIFVMAGIACLACHFLYILNEYLNRNLAYWLLITPFSTDNGDIFHIILMLRGR